MNPIRPSRSASLLGIGEALDKTREGSVPWTSLERFGSLASGHEQRQKVSESKCRGWGGGVVGDRRVGSVDEISRETRRDRNGVHGPKGPKSRLVEVRASIVAKKRGNARGAKGCRKVEAQGL